ncbi:hypothetical protein DICPUDRAFT_85506 [Dictyostelium purpureum]|uniref:Uncharacterized protein n=1 Tax=Dictyostelium purpureum TaxID=5786 RepID=F1A5Y2_DICPU|nr:uncharacterized protein DICPUDRAFT_85506 [Dictyostelium purpureum]EGC28398.1 hypothetical protein DICPUDRAFT_85506 [Dictyostelium purpureum]|eukprot:XP_003295077.1 hypothetical protein DICPUDRAFT_85506 [Dictyostelium purpureum]
MKLELSLLLLLFSTIINYCVGVIITPSSPGGINSAQVNIAPIASVYGNVYLKGASNGIQPIGTCETLKNNLNSEYYPIMILNSTAYFARQLNSKALNLAVVTSKGVYPLEIQPNLIKLGAFNNIQSEISYDDTIGQAGSFIFADKNGKIIIYDIFKDVVKSIGFLSTIEFNTPPYYDYNAKLYYISTFDSSSSSQSILVANFQDYSTNFYSIAKLNLPHSIDSIYTSGYNKQIVLFGSNNEDQKSYLYLINPKSGTYKFLGSKDFNTTMVTGLNPQYLLFVNQEGTLTELLNLQTQTSQTYENTCFDNHYANTFLTSIIPKGIFTN